MTKKLTPRELEKSRKHKAKARAEQAKQDKKITAKLAKLEKAALARIKKLENSKARGKTLARQSESVAAQLVEYTQLRERYKRAPIKKGFIETLFSSPAQLLADFLAISAATIAGYDDVPYSATTSKPRSRAGYKELTTIEICPEFAPMMGKDIGVTDRGKIVERAMLDAQKAFDMFATRNDVITCDFPIASKINYADGTSAMHYSFIDSKAPNACKHYIDIISRMNENPATANVEIVFPINLHLLIKQE